MLDLLLEEPAEEDFGRLDADEGPEDDEDGDGDLVSVVRVLDPFFEAETDLGTAEDSDELEGIWGGGGGVGIEQRKGQRMF